MAIGDSTYFVGLSRAGKFLRYSEGEELVLRSLATGRRREHGGVGFLQATDPQQPLHPSR